MNMFWEMLYNNPVKQGYKCHCHAKWFEHVLRDNLARQSSERGLFVSLSCCWYEHVLIEQSTVKGLLLSLLCQVIWTCSEGYYITVQWSKLLVSLSLSCCWYEHVLIDIIEQTTEIGLLVHCYMSGDMNMFWEIL